MSNKAIITLTQRNNAEHWDITIDKGAAFTLPISFLEPSSSINPTLVPVNLEGYTGLAYIKETYSNPNIMAYFTLVFNGSNPSTGSLYSSGSITISLTANQTKLFEGGIRGIYNLFMYPSGNIELAQRWLEGEVWVRPS